MGSICWLVGVGGGEVYTGSNIGIGRCTKLDQSYGRNKMLCDNLRLLGGWVGHGWRLYPKSMRGVYALRWGVVCVCVCGVGVGGGGVIILGVNP